MLGSQFNKGGKVNDQPNPTSIKKAGSKIKIILVVLTILFFITSVMFATCYILKNKAYTKLQNDYKSLSTTLQTTTPKNTTTTTTSSTTKEDSDLKAQVATLQKENAELEKSKIVAETALAEEKAGEAKATQYNNIIGLLSDLILQRGEVTEFTEADFEQTKVLAEKIGDTELINLMVEKWADHTVNPDINVFTVIKFIQEKIASNIN